jgi:RNA polymerase sigma-70 factor (ECF subfamily)
VAINLSLDTLKKQERRRRWQLPFGKNTVQETSDLADPISWVEQQELQDGIARALQQLSPDFRAVVLLRLVQGYPVAETASMLGIPEGTVASRLARAQQQLRHILRTEGWS